MTDYSHTPLKNSINALLTDIAVQKAGEIDINMLERSAKAILAQLKAIEALQAQQARDAAQRERETYTRFEDLRPPPPEERARMITMLNRHFGVDNGTNETE